jgi:hypothetical protein
VKNGYAALSGRLHEAMNDLARVVARAEELTQRALQSGDDGYWDGVALNLHGFYAGAERIFEDIARTVDEATPVGPDWHRDLLLQMSAPIQDVRPAVIRRETRYCLDKYRGFRHVVRNVYAFNLHPTRLRELVEELRACHQLLGSDLNAFQAILEQLSHTPDN